MCGNTHLVPEEIGAPPWRSPGLRPYLRLLAALAAFDLLLVALVIVH